jgi:hypothetical protein
MASNLATSDLVVCYGNAQPDDTYLAASVHCMRRRLSRSAGGSSAAASVWASVNASGIVVPASSSLVVARVAQATRRAHRPRSVAAVLDPNPTDAAVARALRFVLSARGVARR